MKPIHVLRSMLAGACLLSGLSGANATQLFQDSTVPGARPDFLPAKGMRSVLLNPAARSDLQSNGESHFNAADGSLVQIRWSHSMDHSSGNVTWVGDIAPYGQLNRALVTFFDGGMTGTFQAGARNWDLNTYGKTTWLQDYQVAGVQLLPPGNHRELMKGLIAPMALPANAVPGPAVLDTPVLASGSVRGLSTAPRLAPLAVEVSQVDVLILATDELRDYYGGTLQTRAVMDRMIAFANQVYLDSGVTNLRLNLIASGSLPGTQGMTITKILESYNPSRPEYRKGVNIAELREQVGADLVSILVTNDSTINGGHCGSADLPMQQRDLATQSSEMLSVSASGPAIRGAVYKCGEDYVFLHELGHNFGLMHDRTTLVGQGAPLDKQNLDGGLVGAYPYGFGYGIQDKFCDIMCYRQTFSVDGPGNLGVSGYQTAKPIFSNPNMSLPAAVGGDLAGVSENDPSLSANAALALSNAAPKVASYRSVPGRDAPAANKKKFPIQSGIWWNTEESGRGFFVDQSGSTVIVSGYLYGADGKPVWFTSSGTPVDNALTAPMQTFAGGQTLAGAYKAPGAGPSMGNMTITFDEPDYAILEWAGGSMELQRLDFDDGADNAAEDSLPFQALGDTGIWWNPTEGGRGFTIEIQGGMLAIAGFMFDADGNPTWLLSSGKLTSFKQYKGTWVTFANGQAMGAPYKAPTVSSANAGEVSIDFLTPFDATLTLPDGRKIAITRFKY